jgi:hypothetical protein
VLGNNRQPNGNAWGDEISLIAGPPAASPPLFIALMLVGMSIAGPFIFLKDGTPSPLLGITAIAVAIAGMITMIAAMRAQRRRRADSTARRRVGITRAGITFYPTLHPGDNVQFAWEDITSVQMAPAAFILHAGPQAAKPGRHAIRFGKLVTPRSDILLALDGIRPQPGDAGEPQRR